jgi:hypothetical protein
MRAVDYDSTGYIGRVLNHPSIEGMPEIPLFVIPNDARTFSRIEVADDTDVSQDKQYVLNGAIAQRPTWQPVVSAATIPADGQTPIVISGLPQSSAVQVFGPVTDAWQETSGEVSLTVNLPGSYIVRISPFPYQDVEVKFDAA